MNSKPLTNFRLMGIKGGSTIQAEMSSENIQRQIEFILEHQAKFSEDLELLKEVQSQQAESISELSKVTASLSETVASTQEHLDSVISEMRDGFNKLILSNEVTRDFANKIASLEVQTSQRMTGLELRVSDIESK